MTRVTCVSVFALVVASLDTALGADTYLGQSIVPKHEHIDVRVSPMCPTRVATGLDFPWPATVERVDGQWLRITDDGSYSVMGRPLEGWVSKNDVVLLGLDPIE